MSQYMVEIPPTGIPLSSCTENDDVNDGDFVDESDDANDGDFVDEGLEGDDDEDEVELGVGDIQRYPQRFHAFQQ